MSFRGMHRGRPGRLPQGAPALAAALLPLLLLACSGVPETAARVEDPGSSALLLEWDAVAVGTTPIRYPDLPGFPALEKLRPETRARLMALTNEEPCPCECGHSVAYCVNEVEGCLVSRDRVRELLAFATELDAAAAEAARDLPAEKEMLFSETAPEAEAAPTGGEAPPGS